MQRRWLVVVVGIAALAVVGAPVVRTVEGGPGPSIIDLPRAGGWRLHASWAGLQDELDLAYAPPR